MLDLEPLDSEDSRVGELFPFLSEGVGAGLGGVPPFARTVAILMVVLWRAADWTFGEKKTQGLC